jgi:PAS domain S-box-containing protein
VAALRIGANDFINKEKLSRLGPAIQRELREVAERRARERSESQLRAIFENSLDAMLLTNDDGQFVDANPAACELLGRKHHELIGMNVRDLLPDPRNAFAGSRTGFVTDGRESGVLEVSTADRQRRTVEYNAIGSVLPGVHLSVMRDVTERQEMRARLALSDRLASIGTIAAGVTHEINNPLTFVSANVSHALAVLESTPADGLKDVLDALREAIVGVERIRTIVRDVRTFARADQDDLVAVDVNRVLRSALRVAGVHLRERAIAVRQFGDVPAVRATESRLGQVFLNLIANAVQAMPRRDLSHNTITLRTSRHGDEVCIEVSDTGTGIDAEHLQRLFTPFFTTKGVEAGSGLGLSICHDIVTALGGRIAVESELGRGSTFRVLLPVVATEGADVRPNVVAFDRRSR